MTREEIIKFEQATNGSSITLMKEGTFWRAYEQSAYQLIQLFWPDLKVNGGFVKAVGQEMYYVGFPDLSLQSKVLDKLPEVPGSRLVAHDETTVIISGFLRIEGFEGWKQAFAVLREQANEQMQPFYGKLPLYKAVYDFFHEVVNLTRHFPKDLHYALGDKDLLRQTERLLK